MSNILKGLLKESDIEETKKLTPYEKFKRSMKRAGYDMDAGAKRLQDLLDKQKKEREEFEKKEKEIKEGPAVDAYMAGKSPAIAHFADKLDNIKEDESMQYAAEVTPKISAYAGLEDRKYRGSISEGIKKILENPDYGPTDAGYQPGGWRKMNEQEVSEDLRKWFKEKWVRFGPDGKIRGACARGDDSEGKPKCLPQAKAHALGKKGRKYAAAKKRREDPNPERSGPAKNVATKKKSNESLREFAPNFRDDGDGDSRDIDRLREKIYSLLMKKLANVEGDPQDIALAAMEVADDIASESELVDFTKLSKWVEMVLNKVQGVAEAGMPSSVIKSKQRYSQMTPAEFAQAHKDKSDEELISMAWRHGYGKGSNHYVDKRNKGKQGVAEGSGNWYIRVRGKVLKDKQFNAIPFPSKDEASRKAFEIHNKKRIPIELIKLTQSWMDGPEQGVAESFDYEREPLYHATLKAFEPSITKSGLLPGGNLRMFDWSDKNYVYLSNYPDIARDFVDPGVIEPSEDHEKQILKLMKQGGVILKIDQNKLDRKLLSVDPHFQRDEDTGVETYVYSGIISPNAIIGKEYFPININESMQGVAEGFSDISGLLSASNLNKSFIITAELAEGGKKKFRVKAQNERVAIEKFKKHHSMAKIINVAEEGVEEGSKYPRNPASYHLKKYPVPPDQLARPVKKEPKKPEKKPDEKLDELKCWSGYTRVKGVPAGAPGSCKKKTNEDHQQCPECGGAMYEVSLMNEKKDACYYKVKSRYKVWPSAYASGALVKCRKKGAKNWGSKSKSNEGQIYSTGGGAGQAQRYYTPKDNLGETKSNILSGIFKANK